MRSEAGGSARHGAKAGLSLKAGALIGVAFLHLPLAFIILHAELEIILQQINQRQIGIGFAVGDRESLQH